MPPEVRARMADEGARRGRRNTITSTITAEGQTQTTTRISTSTWLAADCGDVKPFDPNGLGAKPHRPQP